MITALIATASLAIGGVGGFVIGIRQMPRMLARMSTEQIDTLADKVGELRHDTD